MEIQKIEQIEKTFYVCPECEGEFKNPQALKVHQSWKHKDKPTELIMVEEEEKILPETEIREDNNNWGFENNEEEGKNKLNSVVKIVGLIGIVLSVYLLIQFKKNPEFQNSELGQGLSGIMQRLKQRV